MREVEEVIYCAAAHQADLIGKTFGTAVSGYEAAAPRIASCRDGHAQRVDALSAESRYPRTMVSLLSRWSKTQ